MLATRKKKAMECIEGDLAQIKEETLTLKKESIENLEDTEVFKKYTKKKAKSYSTLDDLRKVVEKVVERYDLEEEVSPSIGQFIQGGPEDLSDRPGANPSYFQAKHVFSVHQDAQSTYDASQLTTMLIYVGIPIIILFMAKFWLGF